MDKPFNDMVITTLGRLETKIDKFIEQLNASHSDCERERSDLSNRLKALETVHSESKAMKKDIYLKALDAAGKILMYVIGLYVCGKEVLAKF